MASAQQKWDRQGVALDGREGIPEAWLPWVVSGAISLILSGHSSCHRLGPLSLASPNTKASCWNSPCSSSEKQSGNKAIYALWCPKYDCHLFCYMKLEHAL